MSTALSNSSTSSTARRAITAGLWAWVVVVVVNLVFFVAFNGFEVDDFSNVYRSISRFTHGQRVYTEDYSTFDPHYLYSPGATLLLSPLGLVGKLGVARKLFIMLNAAAIIWGMGLLTRLIKQPLRSPLFPAAIALAFDTESVRSTLTFGNANGLMFLALCGFLYLWLADRRLWAGVVLGLAITIKPMFAPLLLILLVRRDWIAVATSVAIPVVTNAAMWPVLSMGHDYRTIVIPFLKVVRPFANPSLRGIHANYAINQGLFDAIWLFVAACCVVGVVGAYSYWSQDRVASTLTMSSVLLAGVFLLSALGQGYYTMFLFPLFFSAYAAESVLRTPVTWFFLILGLEPAPWFSKYAADLSSKLQPWVATMSWAGVVICAAVLGVLSMRRNGVPWREIVSPQKEHHD